MQPKTAKIIPNGRSQAVRLPKEFRFKGTEVYVRKEGDNVILSPKPESWDTFFDSDLKPTDDFVKIISNRDDVPPQTRNLF